MFAAASQFVPLVTRFCRQIVPPVVATLIAAGLISAYNRTFSAHLQQPRMSALHEANAAEGTTAPITTVGMTKPPVPPAPAVTETITIYEEAIEPERLAEKDAGEEAGKDQSPVKLAAEPAPAPTAVRATSPAPKVEPRVEPHRVASIELAQPIVRAPMPVIVAVPPLITPPASGPVVTAMPAPEQRQPQYQQPYPPYQPQVQQQYQPQPVIVGAAPMVTVPDRPNTQPVEQAQVQSPPPPQGALGTFVNALKPSTWFARAREFGDKVEAAGNDILPNIRQ